jgi:hypothetical protein
MSFTASRLRPGAYYPWLPPGLARGLAREAVHGDLVGLHRAVPAVEGPEVSRDSWFTDATKWLVGGGLRMQPPGQPPTYVDALATTHPRNSSGRDSPLAVATMRLETAACEKEATNARDERGRRFAALVAGWRRRGGSSSLPKGAPGVRERPGVTVRLRGVERRGMPPPCEILGARSESTSSWSKPLKARLGSRRRPSSLASYPGQPRATGNAQSK